MLVIGMMKLITVSRIMIASPLDLLVSPLSYLNGLTSFTFQVEFLVNGFNNKSTTVLKAPAEGTTNLRNSSKPTIRQSTIRAQQNGLPRLRFWNTPYWNTNRHD
jgi:hypothetical protein